MSRIIVIFHPKNENRKEQRIDILSRLKCSSFQDHVFHIIDFRKKSKILR